jgi:hypothetical protein
MNEMGGNIKELFVDHVEHEKIALSLPMYRGEYNNEYKDPDRDKIMRIADRMINQYTHSKKKKLVRGFSPSVDMDDTGWVKMKNNYEPLEDFYKDYKDRTGIHGYRQEFLGEFHVKDIDERTYVNHVSYHPERRRVEVDFDTYHLDERDAGWGGFDGVVSDYEERPYMANPADRTAFIREAWEESKNSYSEALEEGGRKYEFRKNLKKNLMVMIKTRAEPIYNAPLNERIAIDTLREMITEIEFRKYVKHGFILVRASNGCTYQIFRNRDHTKVWHQGAVVREICVRLKSNTNVPPTDNVIAFKVMVETDPDSFEQLGNIYKMAEAA